MLVQSSQVSSLVKPQVQSLVGFDGVFTFIKKFGAPAAAYSLRDLNSPIGNSRVVRVRRDSDDLERDFLAKEVSNGTLQNWVNSSKAPLDVASADGAYSLRNLTATYTGNVIRVRRSSTQHHQDFTAEQITDGTLEAFVGNDDGYVHTWYDQSGNSRNVTQGNKQFQPKIINSGTLITSSNGLPAIDFTDSPAKLQRAEFLTGQLGSYFLVHDAEAGDSEQYQTPFRQGTNFRIATNINTDGSLKITISDNDSPHVSVSSGGDLAVGNPLLHSSFITGRNGTHLYSYVNGGNENTMHIGTEIADVDFSQNDAGDFAIGRHVTNQNNDLHCRVQEAIFYNSNQLSNRQQIEDNIGQHYNISEVPSANNTVNGFVETWYDQSGNGIDAEQATETKQASIVTNGSLNTSGGLEFDGINDVYGLSLSLIHI